MLVTVHSLVLLESRCAECYINDSTTPQRGLCCDGENSESCPSRCDVYLNFCQLESFQELDNNFAEPPELPNSTLPLLLGTNCSQLDLIVGGWLGIDFNTNQVYQYNVTGPIGVAGLLRNPVTYADSGKWLPVREYSQLFFMD